MDDKIRMSLKCRYVANFNGGIITTSNIKKQMINLKNQKYQTLYSKIPFLTTMPFEVRTWWIRYYKLKQTWKTHFNNLHFYPDDYPIGSIPPWEEPNYKNGYLGHNHQLNADLNDIEWLFMQLHYDWMNTRLREIKFPEKIECNFNLEYGCFDCRYRLKCELRGE